MPRPDHLQFGALIHGCCGHIAGWRHPRAKPHGELDLDFHVRLARTLEEAGFATLFVADVADVAAVRGHQLDSPHRTTCAGHLEPITLLAALSQRTSRIGLVATAATGDNEPYHLARKFASLDHVSGGRAGWGVVTRVAPLEAQVFASAGPLGPGGADGPDGSAERYELAAEFVEVVKGLWDSYTDDALIRDKSTGRYFRPDGRRAIDHHGTHFDVAGPLNLARPPQGHPVLFHADASGTTGRAFAARVGEVIVTAPVGSELVGSELVGSEPVGSGAAVECRRQLDDAVTAAGRDPGDLRVWPILTPIVADTDAEAAEILAELGRQRALWCSASGHTAGAPATIADRIATVWRTGAIDGFNVSFPYLPEQVERFTAEVLPLLAERGLFRPAEGATLRERLGLPRPAPRATARSASDWPPTAQGAS